jgi:hypothetical protein
MRRDFAAVRAGAVFGEEHALPGAEQHFAAADRIASEGPVISALRCAGMSSGPSSACS